MARTRQASTVAPSIPDTNFHLCLNVTPDNARGLIDKALVDCGVMNVAGDYVCRISSKGMNVLEVNLLANAITGSITPTLQSIWLTDGAQRDADVGDVLVNDTGQELTLTDLRGQMYCELVFTIPSGGSVTFLRAEGNGL